MAPQATGHASEQRPEVHGSPHPAWRRGPDLAPGDVVERRYRIVRAIGRGAVASVHEARSLKPALRTHGLREVAIKALGPWMAGDRDAAAWLTHEAYLGTRLDHPSLVKVVDFGHLRDGRPYAAMELCRGVPLDRALKVKRTLSPTLVASLIEDAAAGLDHLHAHGLVHRDVKPANLIVEIDPDAWPRLRIVDLGVAGVHDPRRADRLGAVDVGAVGSWGTPAYIAPEQALGLKAGPAADVYGLACVAYHMLTGRRPVGTRSVAATVHAHLFEEIPPASVVNPSLPSAVDGVLAAALEKEPGLRTASAPAFAEQLGAALTR
jgi:serine/threonine protein kinase